MRKNSMTCEQFNKLLEEFKSKKDNTDYCIYLYSKGICIGTLFSQNDFERIKVEDRDNCFLVYDDTISILVDDAELCSI